MVPSLLIVLVSLLGADDTLRVSELLARAGSGLPVAHRLEPAKGRLLVADRRMTDPRFRECVILLLDHSDSGSLGVIINRPTRIGLTELIEDLDPAVAGERAIFVGGPVEMDRLLFLVRDATAPKAADHIFGDIYAGGQLADLTQFLDSKPDDQLRVFLGYAGWGPGQLGGEIRAGGWYLMDSEPDTVFSATPETLWERFERKHGHSILVEMPADAAVRIAGKHAAGP